MKEYTQDIIYKYNRMGDTFEKLNMDKITVLTGSNGSGKSLIRKQTPFAMMRKIGSSDIKDTKGLICSTSMDARTSSNPEWGGLSSIMNDTSWVATSINTYESIRKLFNAIRSEKSKYKFVIIDEFEIGCGEETILALSNFINKELNDLIINTQLEGALIITHSRIGVENLIFDEFLNMEGMTKEEWLNREIVPIDLDQLQKNELFNYIRDKSKK